MARSRMPLGPAPRFGAPRFGAPGTKFRGMAICGVSVLLCLIWFVQMLSFSSIFSAKFTVLKRMEADNKLPFAAFREEGGLLADNTKYICVSYLDMGVPLVFVLAFVAIVVIVG